MNNTVDDYDTHMQCEEYYAPSDAAAKVMMWLMMQSLQVKVCNN